MLFTSARFKMHRLLGVVLCLMALVTSGTVAAETEPPHPEVGMMLYYPLNDNAIDQSGFARHGNLNGTTTVADKWGNTGGALQFNGSSDYVSIPSEATAGLTKFSLSLWVKTTESRTGSGQQYWTNPTIIGMATGGAGSGDFGICLQGGTPGFFGGLTAGTDSSFYSATSINDDTWHHLAVVNDGTTVKLYIDGNLDASGSIPSGLPLDPTAFYLGKSSNTTPLGFAGTVDELRIYGRALTTTEISQLATPPRLPSTPF